MAQNSRPPTTEDSHPATPCSGAADALFHASGVGGLEERACASMGNGAGDGVGADHCNAVVRHHGFSSYNPA